MRTIKRTNFFVVVLIILFNWSSFAAQDPQVRRLINAFVNRAGAGDIKTVRAQIDAGIDVNSLSSDYDQTALMGAAFSNHYEIVKILISSCADVNLQNKHGRTALHFAAMGGYSEIVDILLKIGADATIKDKEGNTPMVYAARIGSAGSVKLLAETPPISRDKIIGVDGCPLDSDKDGVPNYLDKCPDTPAGCKVDKDGCPLDSDKDGVPDCLDKCPDTPTGVKVDQDGCPIVAKEMFEKGRATINVEFDFDKAVIKPKYHDEIKKFADVMKNYPELKVIIEGHTDNIGTTAYNQHLSARRANSIKIYLIKEFGIEESRLLAKGYGESKPIDSNKTAMGRQKNRRVEAVVDYIIKK